ncbi:MAG TPA: MFS transporter [Candidatus Hydrogenedentes bacterium]|nr:MFS transporter [Candidatus Hydrogenedentota bacterium]
MSASDRSSGKTLDAYPKLGFWSLIVTQFQGAFIDNAYKIIITLLLPVLVANPNFPATAASMIVFNLPWIIFPGIAGALSDRYSKRWITIGTKIWEMGVVLSGVAAVMLHNPYILLGTLFVLATQSTFFSPAKYGILPETLPESRLSWANGQLNMWTFLAIILGTAAGGILLDNFKSQLWMAMSIMLVLSIIGVISAWFVSPAPPAEPTRRITLNPYAGVGHYLTLFWQDRRLFFTLVGYSYFWFAGQFVIADVIELGKMTLDNETMQSLLLSMMALGIGFGSLAAGYLSRGAIELGLVPLGLGGLTAMGLFLAIPGHGFMANGSLLFAMGFFAGMYDVPLAATLQQRSPANIKGGMIATSNLFTFGPMLFAAGLFMVLFNMLGWSPQMLFLVSSAFAALVTVYMCATEPIILVRMGLWLINTFLCKMHAEGRQRIPERGGALLVANHLSFLDVLALLSSTGRDVYFVTGREIYNTPWIRRIARTMEIIPVNSDGGPRAMEEAVEAIRNTIARGCIVCVNMEAQLKQDGERVPWYADYRHLVQGLHAPILPVYLTRIWESWYTFKNNTVGWKWPKLWRFPIAVIFGEPVASQATAVEVRTAVLTLGRDWYMRRKHQFQVLHHGFIHRARLHLNKLAIVDAISGEVTYFKALTGSLIFARKLKRLLDQQKMVGVLVPPSVGGVLTNVAIQMLGKVPVNLNYTATAETMASCAKRCDITHVLTSRKFLERLPLQVPGETIFLEDIRASVTKKDQIIGMIFALFAPIRVIEWSLGTPRLTEDDLATVIFSSGSEGEPKGVMLTQRNIISQTTVCSEVFPHDANTRLMGFLPFFHSFGFTGTLWMPIVNGVGGIYHPNPLEPKLIGELVQKYTCSILIGTSTFLQGFIRRCTPEQLQCLIFVVCGAEKLSPRVRVAFKEKFGVEPMEGYGTTECAPIVSFNMPNISSPGFFTSYLKYGTIGQPAPGIMARIVDPESGEPLPLGEAGLLEISGPNIMKGYLGQPEKTAEVIREGWYSTGDIASMDEDGFITITDRLARFSKIGGEMVPHTKVEEVLHSLLDLTEQSLAVASVPDQTKGERLVVLHTLTEQQLDELLSKLDNADLPNLWRPRPNSFYRIEAIPVMGTGKMDIKSVKKMAIALDLGE